MIRHSFRKLTRATIDNLGQASFTSAEAIASSLIPKNAACAWVQAANSMWPHTRIWRWYSSDGSDDRLRGVPESSSLEGSSKNTAVASLKPPSGSVPSSAEADAALDAWGEAMDQGDWETAWEIFESHFPVNNSEFPELEEILAWDPDSEDKAVRRQREEAMQEETARARVRKVDDQGRAHAVGKRKTSIARVWIREGPGLLMVNRRPYDSYFPDMLRRNDMLAPFFVTETLGQFDVMAAVEGGGLMGQAQALRHGIARALQNWDPEMRASLKAAGLLTRDARIVERKKPGRKKARKSFAWVKR